MVVFKEDEIIFLLGAGASVDAQIPHSHQMITKLEELLQQDPHWKKYQLLYFYLKSAIKYADGIKGKFEEDGFNIERLVNTIDDLRKGDEHPLFPFIGSWSPKLSQVTSNDLGLLDEFRFKIVECLRNIWVQPNYDIYAEYYGGLARFQKEYEHRLRVFTLNYDLCVEKACASVGVERGFGGDLHWDWRIFDDEIGDANIFLYKLHGSIDWERLENGHLTYKDNAASISQKNLEIIFGTTYKLQYIDPFLYLAYEFRRRTLSDAKLIIAVGYSFADDHINGILNQALKNQTERKLLVIAPQAEAGKVAQKLDLSNSAQIECLQLSAKEFFESRLSLEILSMLFPEEAPPFEEKIMGNGKENNTGLELVPVDSAAL